MKLFLVTQPTPHRTRKPELGQRVFGFVTCFGWENPVEKARAKYPNQEIVQVQEGLPWRW